MLEGFRAKHEEKAFVQQFALYPFEGVDFTDPAVHKEASAYIRSRLSLVACSDAAPDESEYVLRSSILPDRRLSVSDQQIYKALCTFPETEQDRRIAALFDAAI